MAFARDVYTATGGQTDFTISYPYLDDAHITVSQNGTTLTEVTHYTFPNATTVRLVTGATAGDTIVLKRATSPGTRLVDYTAGVLVESDLDTDSLQGFYLAQESSDTADLALGLDNAENWDAENRRITNVAEPTVSSDAATKSYVDTREGARYDSEEQTATASQTVFTLTGISYEPGVNNLSVYINGVRQAPSAYTETSGSVVTFSSGLTAGDLVQFVSSETTSSSVTDASNVTYAPDGTGSVQTNVQTKLRETSSVKDFGATGDGVTDDATAIQAAVDACADDILFWPAGTYQISTTITLPASITMVGAGASHTILNFTETSTGDMFSRATESNGDYIFEDMAFDGNGSNKSSGNVISILRCRSLHCKRLKITNAYRSAIAVVDDGGSPPTDYGAELMWVEGCEITTNYATGGGVDHIVMGDSVKYGHFSGNTITGIKYGAGIQCYTSHFLNYIGNHISGQGSGHAVGGLRATSATGTPDADGKTRIAVIGNVIENTGYGIQISSNAEYCQVVGNSCLNNQLSGILLDTDDAVCTGNTVHNPGQANSGTHYGIVVTGANGYGNRNLVANNVIRDDQGGSATMDYGLHDSTGADYTVWTNNVISGAITARMQALGTNSSLSWEDVASRTFTPTVDFATTGDFSPTYNTQIGRYRIMGDLVFFTLTIGFDTNAYTTASGNIRIGGLPKTARSGNDGEYAMSVQRHDKVNLGGGYYQLGAATAAGNDFMQLFQSGDAVNSTALATGNFAASTSGFNLEISGFYSFNNLAN